MSCRLLQSMHIGIGVDGCSVNQSYSLCKRGSEATWCPKCQQTSSHNTKTPPTLRSKGTSPQYPGQSQGQWLHGCWKMAVPGRCRQMPGEQSPGAEVAGAARTLGLGGHCWRAACRRGCSGSLWWLTGPQPHSLWARKQQAATTPTFETFPDWFTHHSVNSPAVRHSRAATNPNDFFRTLSALSV